MLTTLYSVEGKTLPWTFEMQQTVGYYSDKSTAKKVAELIREINMPELPGGIDVTVHEYQAEVVRSPAGLRLKDTPRGCITMIHEKLNRQELQRIVNFEFYYKKPEVLILDFSADTSAS